MRVCLCVFERPFCFHYFTVWRFWFYFFLTTQHIYDLQYSIMTEVHTTANCSVRFSFMQVIAEVTVKRRNSTQHTDRGIRSFVGRKYAIYI